MTKKLPNKADKLDQPKGLVYIPEFAPDDSNNVKILEKLIEIAKRPPKVIDRKVG